MKIVGFMPLHYGLEYLRETLLSVKDHVDEFVIIYSPQPSYSHSEGLPCPEKENDLRNAAESVLGSKLIWFAKNFNSEGEHRRTIERVTKWDMIFSVDADEIWEPGLVEPAIKNAWDNPCERVGVAGECWFHFWRSFNEYNEDGFYPIRFQKRKGKPFHASNGIIKSGCIYHMGYAQSPEITKYKISCHGHKDEWKPEWYEKTWLNYKPGDTNLHPTSNDVWKQTKPFDKNLLPDHLKNHKYFNLDKI